MSVPKPLGDPYPMMPPLVPQSFPTPTPPPTLWPAPCACSRVQRQEQVSVKGLLSEYQTRSVDKGEGIKLRCGAIFWKIERFPGASLVSCKTREGLKP